MDIKIRISDDAPIETLSEIEFEQRVSKETIAPTAKFHYGDGTWQTVDNLLDFHRSSQRDFPPGEILKVRLHDDFVAEQRSRHFMKFFSEYSEGDLIAQRFLLRPLNEHSAREGVLAATRLYFIPSFDPERIVTFEFKEGAITIETVNSSISLWYSLVRDAYDAAIAEAVETNQEYINYLNVEKKRSRLRTGIRIPIDLKKPRFGQNSIVRKTFSIKSPQGFSLTSILKIVQSTPPPVRNRIYDGIGYRHEFLVDGKVTRATWRNPSETENPKVMSILNCYEKLLSLVGR